MRGQCPFQTTHSIELPDVGCHKNGAAAAGLTGKQDIVCPDRPSGELQLSANLASRFGIIVVDALTGLRQTDWVV